eukprot:gnl/MRDRNA2_/MRDRNA2_93338_c0_seq1.p1 gnl/MRDRNA2_/MRDRNA2_93338_c0~~gnl/MRDRNA2_/MRDRNA2_93338_c0_seq1.p1  ORF type:complete len:412 (+),score=95.64 gnl/MRDRNA2_/MRDRNA2_93338_c0_seq1:63-1238(+)
MARDPDLTSSSYEEFDIQSREQVRQWMQGPGLSFDDWLQRADEEGLNLLASAPVSPPPGCASVFPASQPSVAPDVLAPSSRAQTRGFRASAHWIRPDRPLSKPCRPSQVDFIQPESDRTEKSEDFPTVSDPKLRAPKVDWSKKHIQKHLGVAEYHRRKQSLQGKMKDLQCEESQSCHKMRNLAADTRRAAEESLDSALWEDKIAQALAQGIEPTSIEFPKRPIPCPGQSPIWPESLMKGPPGVSMSKQQQQQQARTLQLQQLQRQKELQIAQEIEEQRQREEEEKQRLIEEAAQKPKPDAAEMKKKHWAFLKNQIKRIEETREIQTSQEAVRFTPRGQQPSKGSGKGALHAMAGSPRIADLLEAAEKQELQGGATKRPPDNYTSLRQVAPK